MILDKNKKYITPGGLELHYSGSLWCDRSHDMRIVDCDMQNLFGNTLTEVVEMVEVEGIDSTTTPSDTWTYLNNRFNMPHLKAGTQVTLKLIATYPEGSEVAE